MTPVLAAVVGSPVAHSRSPAIHNAAFAATGLPWRYVAVEVGRGGGAAALDAARRAGARGLSVTMPLKDEMAGLADELEPRAARLGAVNCLTLAGGRWIGANTDGDGFLDAMAEAGVPVAGRRWLVLGAGGAARAVVVALADAGAADVAVAGRTPDRVAAAAELAGAVGRPGRAGDATEADAVVNATPVGMGGGDDLPLDPGLLRRGQAVVDLVYDPLDTALLRAARSSGATAVDGIGMLVHQAAHAFRRWTGVPAPVEVMRAAAAAGPGDGTALTDWPPALPAGAPGPGEASATAPGPGG